MKRKPRLPFVNADKPDRLWLLAAWLWDLPEGDVGTVRTWLGNRVVDIRYLLWTVRKGRL